MYEAIGLSVSIGGRCIVDRVDLAVEPGRIVVVIGPNGAGKSTLLRAMAGERRPSEGFVRLHGRDIGTFTPRELAGWRAVLGQSVALTFPFSVADVVGLGVPPTHRTADRGALVARGLAAVGLASEAERPITHLSGGEQQRAHAARVLVQLWAQPDDGKARYLLLDEPTTHLDPAHQLAILNLARRQAHVGGGVLAVLHDLTLAAALADTIAVIHHGRIVASGPPHAVLQEDLLCEIYGVAFEITRQAGRIWIRPPMLAPGTDAFEPARVTSLPAA